MRRIAAPLLVFSRFLSLAAPLALGGCSVKGPDDTAPQHDSDTGPTGDFGDSGDTADSAETGPPDLDADGYDLTADCNDADADVHPGAEEVWDGVDNDCDGAADADGDYTGSAHTNATAIYKGQSRSFSMDCPTVLSRNGTTVAFAMTCTPDAADSYAQLLLGETLTLSADWTGVSGQTWKGGATVTSSNGWDSDADATATWSSFTDVALRVSLRASSLTVNASGTAVR